MADNLEAGKDKKADLVDPRGGQTPGLEHRVERPKMYDETGDYIEGTGKKDSEPVEPKKEEPINYDNMSFSEAYRAARNKNKEAGIAHYGDERGYFTYKGKKYNTESREEKAKRTGK